MHLQDNSVRESPTKSLTMMHQVLFLVSSPLCLVPLKRSLENSSATKFVVMSSEERLAQETSQVKTTTLMDGVSMELTEPFAKLATSLSREPQTSSLTLSPPLDLLSAALLTQKS